MSSQTLKVWTQIVQIFNLTFQTLCSQNHTHQQAIHQDKVLEKLRVSIKNWTFSTKIWEIQMLHLYIHNLEVHVMILFVRNQQVDYKEN